jgi:phosphatidylserine synthase
MKGSEGHPLLLWLLPQALTACRILLGGVGLLAVIHRQAELAATTISLAPITDCLDGPLARKLKVSSDFGSLFDYFADYLCYIVVPVALSWLLADGAAGTLHLGILGVPLLAGAARYARNAGAMRIQNFDDLGIPGLGTVFYALTVAAAAFLTVHGRVGSTRLMPLLLPGALIFSLGMLLPLRYPKLMKYPAVLVPVVVGLAVMPFALTSELALCTLVLVAGYTVVSPFLIRQRSSKPSPRSAAKPLNLREQ